MGVAQLDHERWMAQALAQARGAASLGEVPVGAVVVCDDELVSVGANACVSTHDPTAHAEIVALRAAGRQLGNYRLSECALYVTVEPCTMCAGAAVHARVGSLIYGATEPKSGALVSTARVLDNPALNHRIEVHGGVLAADCGTVLREFFAARRAAAAVDVDATVGAADV